MIEFSDITLRESGGDKEKVQKLMKVPTWMLKSTGVVTTDFVTATYILHFWSDGNVLIVDTDRPLKDDIPDDDLRELHDWCFNHGWTDLKVAERLLMNRNSIEFWNKIYISGLVKSEKLHRREVAEMNRLKQFQEIEEEDGS